MNLPPVDRDYILGRHAAGLRDFSGVPLRGIDLSNAPLAGAVFERCDLRDADFRGANVQGGRFDDARLARADFHQAHLLSACFRRCRLTRTNFQHALLEHATFPMATINADFRKADLAGADFSGSHLVATTLHTLPSDHLYNLAGASVHTFAPDGRAVPHVLDGAHETFADGTIARRRRVICLHSPDGWIVVDADNPRPRLAAAYIEILRKARTPLHLGHARWLLPRLQLLATPDHRGRILPSAPADSGTQP